VACDTSQRGWTHVTLTPETATAQWRFVSSVVEPTYQVSASESLVTLRSARTCLIDRPRDAVKTFPQSAPSDA
jgi:hypothetical protein